MGPKIHMKFNLITTEPSVSELRNSVNMQNAHQIVPRDVEPMHTYIHTYIHTYRHTHFLTSGTLAADCLLPPIKFEHNRLSRC